MKADDKKVLPLDEQAILSSENEDHEQLNNYFRKLIKSLQEMYSHLSNIININDDLDRVTSGITASTTQTQGQQPLTSTINEISTVANANDTVTLPTAKIGLTAVIINNGANTLKIFPASSDNLGAGVDTSTTLASGSNVTYRAYDITNWEST